MCDNQLGLFPFSITDLPFTHAFHPSLQGFQQSERDRLALNATEKQKINPKSKIGTKHLLSSVVRQTTNGT